MLRTANGTDVHMYGHCYPTFGLGLNRKLRWVFIIADCYWHKLPAAFLSTRRRSVQENMDRQASLTLTGWHAVVNQITTQHAGTPTQQPNNGLLHDYSGILRHACLLPAFILKVTHHIETTGTPTFNRSRRVGPDKFRMPRATPDSPHRESHFFAVRLQDLHPHRFSSSIQKITVGEKDILKTALTTPFGLLKSGLSNAAQTFQSYMH